MASRQLKKCRCGVQAETEEHIGCASRTWLDGQDPQPAGCALGHRQILKWQPSCSCNTWLAAHCKHQQRSEHRLDCVTWQPPPAQTQRQSAAALLEGGRRKLECLPWQAGKRGGAGLLVLPVCPG